METGPSPLAERLVSVLLPASRREEVMGDLQERFQSPRQYIGEAFRTVPFVVWSQIRRTTNISLLATQSVLMGAVLISMTRGYAPDLTQQPVFAAQVLIEIAIAVMTMVLRDAYAAADRQESERFADHALGPVNVVLAEYVMGVLGSRYALPLAAVVASSAVGILAVIRARDARRAGRGSTAAGRTATLRDEAALNEANSLQRRMSWSGLAVILGGLAMLLPAAQSPWIPVVVLFGFGGFAATWIKWENSRLTVRWDYDAVRQLEDRRDRMRYWSFVARSSGINVGLTAVIIWFISWSTGWGEPSKAVVLVGIGALWMRGYLIGHGLSRRAARALQREIDSIDSSRRPE